MLQRGLSITPSINLVTNIGYGREATHTKNERSSSSNLPVGSAAFPLIHPENIEPDAQADAYTFKNEFGIDATLRQRIVGPVRRTFPKTFVRIKRVLGKER